MLGNELVTTFVNFVTSEFIWALFGGITVFFYLLIALLTWSFIKPLKFLGVPTIIASFLFLFMYSGVAMAPQGLSYVNAIKACLQPVLTMGIICLVMGVAMMILARILDNMYKNRINEDKVYDGMSVEKIDEIDNGEVNDVHYE